MGITKRQEKREIFINKLKYDYELTNNTIYYKEYREELVMDMIKQCSYYIEEFKLPYYEGGECDILHSLIRALANFNNARSKKNKKAIIDLFQELEEFKNHSIMGLTYKGREL